MVGVGRVVEVWVGEVMFAVLATALWLSNVRGFVSWGGVMLVDIDRRDTISSGSLTRSVICIYICFLFVGGRPGYTVNHLNPHLRVTLVSEILPTLGQYYLKPSYGTNEVRTVGYIRTS
jgi:hypothetical protein